MKDWKSDLITSVIVGFVGGTIGALIFRAMIMMGG